MGFIPGEELNGREERGAGDRIDPIKDRHGGSGFGAAGVEPFHDPAMEACSAGILVRLGMSTWSWKALTVKQLPIGSSIEDDVLGKVAGEQLGPANFNLGGLSISSCVGPRVVNRSGVSPIVCVRLESVELQSADVASLVESINRKSKRDNLEVLITDEDHHCTIKRRGSTNASQHRWRVGR